MAETTDTIVVDEEELDAPSEYTTESAPAVDTPARPVNIAPAAATGRRKEAVARVRIVPGTGTWTVNGRALDQYFPNKLHQQTINEPFLTAAVEGSYDVVAKIIGDHGGAVSCESSAGRTTFKVLLPMAAARDGRASDE